MREPIGGAGPSGAGGPHGRVSEADATTPTPGILILVVGPSGAGKDTLIAAARARFAARQDLWFPQRIITRQDDTGEPHIAMSPVEFAAAEQAGKFFLSWSAHGQGYGLPGEIAPALKAGRSVVVNISRRMIDAARRAWPHCHVIHVRVDPKVLAQRLRKRGRETPEEIAARLARAEAVSVPEAAWVSTLDNSGALEDAITRFCALIEAQLTSGTCAICRNSAP